MKKTFTKILCALFIVLTLFAFAPSGLLDFDTQAAEAMLKKTYPTYCSIKTTKSTYIKSMPCSENSDKNSKTLETVASGKTVKAYAVAQNKYDNLWYKVKTQKGAWGYIYSGDTSFVSADASDIVFSGVPAPSAEHRQASSFPLKGTVKTTYSKLKAIGLYFKTYSSTSTSSMNVTGGYDEPTSNTYSFSGSKIDKAINFSALKPGNKYRYTLKASSVCYYAQSTKVLRYVEAVKTAYDMVFEVVKAPPTKTITPTNGGVYKIATALKSGMFLDFEVTGDNVQIYQNCDNNIIPGFRESQYFLITSAGNGWYTIKNPNNGLVIDVAGGKAVSGTNAQQHKANGSNAQLFRFVDAGNGYCYIESKLGTFLDVKSAETDNNTNVQLYKFNESTAQKWKLVAHSHTNTTKVTKNATCTAAGSKTLTCSVCGYVSTESISALGHTKTGWTTVTAATCTKAGSQKRSCTICKATETRTVAATGHKIVTVGGRAATCTQTGLTEGKKCSVCGTVTVAQKTFAVKAHTIVTIPGKAATCGATGLTEGKKCSVCGTVTGAQKTIPVNSAAHTMVTTPGKAPTCTAPGYSEGTKCSVCGTVGTANATIPALPHTETVIPGKAATCTAPGLTNGKKCTVCGTVTLAQTAIPATGHSETVIPAVEATYTNTGLTEGKKCSVCGVILAKQQEIARKTISKVTGLKAKTVKTNSITLSWKAVDGAEGYKVYYSTDGKKWKSKTTSKTTYTFKKLSSGKSYQYKVKAVIGEYSGAASAVLKTATRVEEVILESVKSAKKAQATVKWEKTDGANGYVVEYSTSKKFTSKTTKKVTIKKGKTVKTTLKKLKSGKKYYVRVKAYKTVNGKNIYGARSGAYSVKVK